MTGMDGSGRRLFVQVLLAAAGAGGMIAGLTTRLAELISEEPAPRFVLAASVAAAGGAALVFLPRLRLRPTPMGVVVTLVTALAGTAAGLLRSIESTCCAYAYLVGRGYPFEWLRRGDTGDTPAAARAATLDKPWNRHWDAFAADLAFWGFAGVLAVVVVALLRRAVRRAPVPAGT